MPAQLLDSAASIDTANKGQSSQGLIIQTYCQSVKSQPNVDFTGFTNLAKYQTEINTGLGRAQAHADTYLTVIQPNIITNIKNISSYYDLHNAVPMVLPLGSTEEKWIEVLTTLQTAAATNQGTAAATVTSLQGLYNNLTNDAGSFATTVSELNAAVSGDNGALADIDNQVKDIQSRINGTIVGIVVSGLAIVGGGIMVGVGALTEIFTGGASTALVIGGLAVAAAGVAGVVGASIALKGLYDSKVGLLTSKSSLKAEVQLAQGINAGFSDLHTQVGSAITSAQQMVNAWDFLSKDLGALSDDLKNGIQKADAVRALWLAAADSKLQKDVITDIATIKQQMTGVTVLQVVPGRNVNDTIDELLRRTAAA